MGVNIPIRKCTDVRICTIQGF